MFPEEISKTRIKTLSLIFLSKFLLILSPCRKNVCIMTVRFLSKYHEILCVLVIQCYFSFLCQQGRILLSENCAFFFFFFLQPALHTENSFRFCTVKHHHWNFAEAQTVFHWMIISLNVLSLVYAACIVQEIYSRLSSI